MNSLRHAFKEWAVICRALALGKQALILRKGGIAEQSGEFMLEHKRFWLYPTYMHQQATGIKPEGLPLLHEAELDQPGAGMIRLSHFAEVTGVYHLHDMVGPLLVRQMHLWSDETILARFTYRRPGLYLLAVRVYKAAATYELPELPQFAGCRSWVELEQELSISAATPVLEDAEFQSIESRLDQLLNPIALA